MSLSILSILFNFRIFDLTYLLFYYYIFKKIYFTLVLKFYFELLCCINFNGTIFIFSQKKMFSMCLGFCLVIVLSRTSWMIFLAETFHKSYQLLVSYAIHLLLNSNFKPCLFFNSIYFKTLSLYLFFSLFLSFLSSPFLFSFNILVNTPGKAQVTIPNARYQTQIYHMQDMIILQYYLYELKLLYFLDFILWDKGSLI